MTTATLHELPTKRPPPQEEPVLVAPAPYVTIKMFALISGLTEKAIRRKMEDGKWVDGKEYRRSPDGGIFISIKGYQKWVEQGAA